MQNGRNLILVVDDEARNRALLRGVLGATCEIVEADCGQRALEIAETQEVDLVLLDVMMPGQDGFETCRLLKERPRDVFLPVILVTALGEQGDRNAGLEAGADDFLPKPFDRRELTLRVRNFLRLRQQERVIRDQVAELRKLQGLKDDLVSLLVHDLRNPLAGVISSIELAAEKPSSPDQASDLERALKGASGLRGVLDETLQVRLLEEDVLLARRAPADLEALARAAIATVESTAKRRRVHVSLLVEGDRTARLDEKLVRRSLENLLANALRYTPPGSAVDVRTLQRDGIVELDVSDRGPGVPDAMKSSLFEKFGSVEARQGGTRQGVGLGLYLVKLVAEAHGGEVSIHDRPGGGALLRLRLSAGEPSPAEAAA